MFSALVDFIFPKTCAICGRVDTWLCQTCAQSLSGAEVHTPPQGLDGLSCLFNYKQKEVKKLVETIKYDFLPEVILECVTQTRLPKLRFSALTFVPLHRRRQNWRGFNQAEKLAQRLGQLTGLPVIQTLERSKYTQPLAQAGRASQRQKEIKDAFRPKRDIDVADKNLILVDDVYTSGATMKEAARVLKQSGAKIVWGWTLAS